MVALEHAAVRNEISAEDRYEEKVSIFGQSFTQTLSSTCNVRDKRNICKDRHTFVKFEIQYVAVF